MPQLMQLYYFFLRLPSFWQCKLHVVKEFCGSGKSVKGDFLYFSDNIMDLWVEFWKFVSKCIQDFTWPYVYIYIWNFRKVCIVIQPEMDVNKLYIVKNMDYIFGLKSRSMTLKRPHRNAVCKTNSQNTKHIHCSTSHFLLYLGTYQPTIKLNYAKCSHISVTIRMSSDKINCKII